MQVQLKDSDQWAQLRPITLTRSVADIRIGIFTIREKWSKYLQQDIEINTQDYLQNLYGSRPIPEGLIINSAVLPDIHLANNILKLKKGDKLDYEGTWIASYGESTTQTYSYDREISILNYPEDIFLSVEQEIIKDIKLIQSGLGRGTISDSNRIVGDKNQVYTAEGAKIECCILNVEDGPIYIGKGAKVLEGAILRGPLAIGDHSVIKMGAKIYQKTSFGPHCKVGGEVSNAVILGYSNKGHDGYMGNAVIGEWCNWGADTNNSNLKNNYTHVKLWDYESGRFRKTGQQFAGIIMGDHCKTGINTMFNTGTVLGVSCNVFGYGFPRNFIPSFSWGGAQGFKTYTINKALETAEAMQNRRGKQLSKEEIEVLNYLYEKSAQYRSWERA